MGDEVEKFVRYARRRYNTDVEFHAKVELVKMIVVANFPDLTQDVEIVGLIVIAASLSQALEWVDLATGRITDT